MALMDYISDAFDKIAPPKSLKASPLSGGIGSGGHGMVPIDDDMIVSKPAIVCYALQIFFNFLAMACFASVASFQAKFHVGPSGLSSFSIFISIVGILLSLFLVLVPVLYEKYDKFVRLARALREVRVAFILTGTGATFSLLIAFITAISAWTQAGCKNAENDPHAKEAGDDFVRNLPGWCSTKKAGSVFFWLTFVSWGASLTLLILDWRSGKLAPRDPPFTHPVTNDDAEGGEEDDDYHHIPPVRHASAYDNSDSISSPFNDTNRYNAPQVSPYTPAPPPVNIPTSRPSMDAYGAFSDPAPTGFGGSTIDDSHPSGPPVLPEPDLGPRVSRTMQYADPYAAVRATIGTPQAGPPTYDSYQGYR
ncbi:hypothetical protein BDN72DRAFT_800164 [Pluteus cervinus]|uniref:Uncharacterized protein n=1 Tax=Pluteus cervinus TaxID=181527 RepID=A0ACD3AL15_9AGAR|nr:hypothetical protein BDN72DRAFT_800164 [Pluteus cervinus]